MDHHIEQLFVDFKIVVSMRVSKQETLKVSLFQDPFQHGLRDFRILDHNLPRGKWNPPQERLRRIGFEKFKNEYFTWKNQPKRVEVPKES
ncbi:hypothetical protein L596_001544 [Steinernema carpocapsae]|uniref:Uncharacterized protein n=1 Tax=Steinernema carpocapsae TaxID=34508 RepID=A0A4V6I7F1_STECR|nr:hypothetical protein L596_001544 [Steinernema carpocapsae]